MLIKQHDILCRFIIKYPNIIANIIILLGIILL